MTRIALGVIMLFLAGCASWSSFRRPSAVLLEQADRLVAGGEYAGALEAYDELLAKYSEDSAATPARGRRQLLVTLLATRAEVERLRRETAERERELGRLAEDLARREAELGRLRADLVGRDAEVGRLRREIGARQAELQRLAGEAERLRADLENLKRLDVDLQRRRPPR